MRKIFHDWQAENITSILHEHRGGYANNKASVRALDAKAQAEGVRVHSGVRVTGFLMEDGRVSAVQTDGGVVGCEHIVVAVGPWVRDIWRMLDLPEKITVKGPDGELYRDREMIGVGALVAKELMDEPQELLEPFRFSRYETGELHPTSHSPFPWS